MPPPDTINFYSPADYGWRIAKSADLLAWLSRAGEGDIWATVDDSDASYTDLRGVEDYAASQRSMWSKDASGVLIADDAFGEDEDVLDSHQSFAAAMAELYRYLYDEAKLKADQNKPARPSATAATEIARQQLEKDRQEAEDQARLWEKDIARLEDKLRNKARKMCAAECGRPVDAASSIVRTRRTYEQVGWEGEPHNSCPRYERIEGEPFPEPVVLYFGPRESAGYLLCEQCHEAEADIPVTPAHEAFLHPEPCFGCQAPIRVIAAPDWRPEWNGQNNFCSNDCLHDWRVEQGLRTPQ